MNETLKPYVEKLLNGGMKTAEEILKFVEMQTPELMNEMLLWGAVSEIAAPIIGILMIVFGFIIHYKLKNTESYYEVDCVSEPPIFMFTVILWFGGLLLFFVQIFDVLYPLIAPRFYILEKISTFIK